MNRRMQRHTLERSRRHYTARPPRFDRVRSRRYSPTVWSRRAADHRRCTSPALPFTGSPGSAMRLFLLAVVLAFSSAATFPAAQQNQLRVFIRSGPKTHGPGAHDHPRFLKDWVPLLNARGARATGADSFPTKAQFDDTDVLILHAQDAGNIPDATDRRNLADFLARGGGLVTIHAAAVSRDPDWFRAI